MFDFWIMQTELVTISPKLFSESLSFHFHFLHHLCCYVFTAAFEATKSNYLNVNYASRSSLNLMTSDLLEAHVLWNEWLRKLEIFLRIFCYMYLIWHLLNYELNSGIHLIKDDSFVRFIRIKIIFRLVSFNVRIINQTSEKRTCRANCL